MDLDFKIFWQWEISRLRLKCDGTRAETRFGISAKRTSPFKSAGSSVQSTAGSRGVRISGSSAGYTVFRDSVRVLATKSIRQFPLQFPCRASPCAIRFQLDSDVEKRPALYNWLIDWLAFGFEPLRIRCT
jgi:hypothetical protein